MGGHRFCSGLSRKPFHFGFKFYPCPSVALHGLHSLTGSNMLLFAGSTIDQQWEDRIHCSRKRQTWGDEQTNKSRRQMDCWLLMIPADTSYHLDIPTDPISQLLPTVTQVRPAPWKKSATGVQSESHRGWLGGPWVKLKNQPWPARGRSNSLDFYATKKGMSITCHPGIVYIHFYGYQTFSPMQVCNVDIWSWMKIILSP